MQEDERTHLPTRIADDDPMANRLRTCGGCGGTATAATVVHHLAGSTTPNHDQLGKNADRDLLRRFCADIETDRRMYGIERLLPEPLLGEMLEYRARAALAADHAHVGSVRIDRLAQAQLILLVTARHHDDVGVAVD